VRKLNRSVSSKKMKGEQKQEGTEPTSKRRILREKMKE
jgi:hypothetical protein